MKKELKLAAFFCMTVLLTGQTNAQKNPTLFYSQLSDQEIRVLLIKQSNRLYAGQCPCPYNRDTKTGKHCGKRSVWSKAVEAAPKCYVNDISDEMVRKFREARFGQTKTAR